MKNILLIAICLCFSRSLNAQIRPAIKQTSIVKTDINQQTTAVSTIKRILPTTVNENLVFYKWKATRLGHNPLAGGNMDYSAPNFMFNGNGTVSCEGSIFSLSDNQLVNGTYTVNGNNVIIVLKQDSSAIMTGNLVYDKVSKKLNGSYSLQILKGYAAGTSLSSSMKLEINSQ